MSTTKRVLVIGDLHEPFCLNSYFDFIKDVQKRYKTERTVFIGDVCDQHANSVHDHDPDGYSAGHELELTIERLGRWHRAFKGADVIIGNHDRRVMKRMFSAGIPKKWQRSFSDVLEVPTWNFVTRQTIDGVLYLHGEGLTATKTAMRLGVSAVQGHRHSEAYAHIIPTDSKNVFAMQVGCGVDKEAYAMAYAKDGPPQALSCGVVIGGTLPIVIPMQ